ncbi:MAG: AAA family ATPase [Candidatus Moranbacteria bacterium]|nr:AAA family ATPase [Candidatus Moranbacteria bacterium]
MYLRKIELSGFKSFAQRTTLEFLPACSFRPGKNHCGITAIVGPNGSGKSNIADAIRWTMGEQSMKNLRGKKSEDVIFAGSGKKSRLGSAIVTLHFDNSDKKIPLEFSEVTISRKLFRNGESDYLINGNRVRLIDVIDILAKAGVGKESYCVINQGMTDGVLSATPSERRVVLEDAAGVKQYQIKKERAIRKLESSQTNLERVGDLVKEIAPHLRMLKRQAAKAQKGKELVAVLREKQIKLFSYLWHVFQKEKEILSGEKNDLGAKMMNVQRAVDKMNDELNKESREVQDFRKLEALEKEKETLREQLNALEKELVITEGRLEIEREKKIQDELIEQIPVDHGYVRDHLEKIRRDQEKLIERLGKVERLEELQDIREFARAIQQELFELRRIIGEGKVEVEKEMSAEAEAQKEKIKNLSVMMEKIRKKIEQQKKEIERVGEAIGQETERSKNLRQKFFELERMTRAKQDELGKLKDQFNEAKVDLAKVEVREEDLTGQIYNELRLKPNDLRYDGQPCNKEELEREIAKTKVQLEQAGGIDPLIIEEYEETRKRFEFLSQESEDLKKAMKSLREVIKEMDQKISKIFNEAFERINEEFTKYFRIIFGGGNAYLIKSKIKNQKLKLREEELINIKDNETGTEADEDKLEELEEEKEEIGIDIFACPPGKRITSLNMLSGGERSLTSIALLFSIISYNPPPFSVLDEVDAALDEANSRRFGRILQELAANTQFVVITHNRETMRQASLLYGVTMGSDGISKLLSIRLDQVGEEGKIIDEAERQRAS